jgi:putative peptidoglycan lipid II flippase
MALPFFVTAWFKSGRVTDPYFLAVGTMLFVTTILAAVLEQIVVPFAIEYKASGRSVFRSSIARLAAQAGGIAAVLSVLAALAMALLVLPRTNLGPEQVSDVVHYLLILWPLPVLITLSSVISASHYVFGRYGWATSSQLLRPAGALVLGWATRGSGLDGVVAGLILGELLRLILLSCIAFRLVTSLADTEISERPNLGTFWRVATPQLVSVAIVGLAPLTDKLVAAGHSAGSVTIVELAEKLFYTPMVLISSGVALVAGTAWAEMAQRPSMADELRHDFWRTQRFLVAGGVAVACLAGLFIWFFKGWVSVFLGFSDSELFARTFLLFAAGLPFALSVTLGTRLLLSCRRTRLLPAFAVLSTAANLVFDLLFARWFGVPGIALASSAVRALSCGLLLAAGRSALSGRELTRKDARWLALQA